MYSGVVNAENEMPKFNSDMIKCFQPKGEKFFAKNNLTRYHYTSANALMKILKTDNDTACVRFTDVRYLNDKSEMLFFVKRLLEFLRDNRSKYPFCCEVVNDLLLKKHSEQEYIDLTVPKIEFTDLEKLSFAESRSFVFCTCKESDSLNMWNYYVQNGEYQGYSIGIDLYKFLKSFDVNNKGDALDPIFFFYGEVIYSERKQKRQIETICNKIERNNVKTRSDDYQYSMYELYMYICSHGMFFKDKNFEHEKEYRILIMMSEACVSKDKTSFNNKFNKEIKLNFYERMGILVPCLEVPFEKESIKSITIAPIMERTIALSGISEFLKVNEYKNVSVDFSKIPIRY